MKSKVKLVIVLFGIISFGLLFIISNTVAIQRETTISTIASKDTYVNSYYPTSNYGGVNYLDTGFLSGNIMEAYFYFNFSDKPSNFIRAEISLDFGGVYQTMNFSVCLIEEEWDELTMTWIDYRPSKGQVLDYVLASSNAIYTIDITSFIAGRTNISICVYIDIENYINDYAYITSREGYIFTEDAPQLIWTYMENAEITVTNPSSSSNWKESNFYTIRWTSIGNIEDVKIDLYKGSSFIEEITWVLGYTENDGKEDFYVASAENYKGSDYRIKITDYNDVSVYDYSDYFSINVENEAPFNILGYNVFIIIGIIGMSMIIIAKKKDICKIFSK
ncbi:MAG: DNRLRE domain-containing protein [Candidatus Thorarchaeota archaeon]